MTWTQWRRKLTIVWHGMVLSAAYGRLGIKNKEKGNTTTRSMHAKHELKIQYISI